MTSQIDVPLADGLKVGNDVLKDAVVRELGGADLIDAQFEAERLVETKTGPQFVTSPAAMGLALLRRQVVRVGNVQGPLAVSDLKKLSARDLTALQVAADTLDAAAAAAINGAVADRGRADGVGAAS
jgi:phage FluMu protein gp41